MWLTRMGKSIAVSWEKQLFGTLASALLPLGFVYREGSNSYIRKVDEEITHFIHLNVGKYQRPTPRINVLVSVSVRHEIVQKLTEGWRKDLNPKSRKQMATIGQELGVIKSGQSRSFTITDETEIGNTALSIVDMLWQVGFPYLERMSDLRNVYNAYSNAQSRLAAIFLPIPAFNIPVLKGLLDGHETSLPLFGYWYRQLKEAKDPNATDYPSFAAYVEEQWKVPINLTAD